MKNNATFFIYRVYFTPEDIFIYVIENPYQKSIDKTLKCLPTNYRLDFLETSVDRKLKNYE